MNTTQLKHWSTQEVKLVMAELSGAKDKKVAAEILSKEKLPNRSPATIMWKFYTERNKKRKIDKLQKTTSRKFRGRKEWTLSEEAQLLNIMELASNKYIGIRNAAIKLGRSAVSVSKKLDYMKKSKHNFSQNNSVLKNENKRSKSWEDSEIAILNEIMKSTRNKRAGVKKAAKELGRSYGSVYQKIEYMDKIKKPKNNILNDFDHKKWTLGDIATLEKNVKNSVNLQSGIRITAAELYRSFSAVEKMYYKIQSEQAKKASSPLNNKIELVDEHINNNSSTNAAKNLIPLISFNVKIGGINIETKNINKVHVNFNSDTNMVEIFEI